MDAVAISLATQWELLKTHVKEEAQKLVDDFPDNKAQTLNAPVQAEEFCQRNAPTSLAELQLLMAASSMTLNDFKANRQLLSLRNQYKPR